jgi:hypothetical protein
LDQILTTGERYVLLYMKLREGKEGAITRVLADWGTGEEEILFILLFLALYSTVESYSYVHSTSDAEVKFAFCLRRSCPPLKRRP